MEVERYQTLQCCNPFKKHNHSVKNIKRLRNVSEWMCDMFPDMMPKISKICDNCRKQIGSLKNMPENIDCRKLSDDDDQTSYVPPPSAVVETLNTSLQELGESPIRSTKLELKQYSTKKFKNIGLALKKQLFANAEDSSDDECEPLEKSVIANLKTSFSSSSRKKKLMLLTCLPESWSIRKIMREFNAPNYMVRQAKWLLKERGILESPDQKLGKNLSQEVVKTVRSFYESDEISRVMPGKKDCVTVKMENGDKTVMSKRLILCNLKEAYKIFKDKFQEMKILGFSTFAELHPKHCILAGHSGTHSVCVCTTHQNVKLMIEKAKLGMLSNGELISYKHFLAKMLCNPASIHCIMGHCSSCPGSDPIKNTLQNAFDNNMVENITFRQWVSVDRCNLETMQKTSSEFIELFSEKLTTLILHDFLAKQQSSFVNEVKENLNVGEYVVTCDFSENYTFVIQDEAQSYHWSSDHATVHPFVVYYKGEKKTEHISYVIISNCLEHNTIAVYCFQKKLIQFLKTKFQTVQKIYYFSDGSAAQYKNKKNFTNLCFHKEDFGIDTEWHFFASAHGKGPCDGVGGTLKRLATKASLQRPYDNQILTPQQLFDWADKNITSIHFEFSTQEEYIETEIFLEERFSQSLTIKGTQRLHAFIPIASSTSKLLVKTFSDTTESTVETVTKSLEKLALRDIYGYVTAIYDKKWWLAYVLAKEEDLDEVKVTFLHPAGPSMSYTYPTKPDVLWVPVNDVLCKVNPVTPTGRIYQIPRDDTVKTNEAFKRQCKSCKT